MSHRRGDPRSTKRWQAIRLVVLERDGWKCQLPLPEKGGAICGAYATIAGHIIPQEEDGADDPANLRAECVAHSSTRLNEKLRAMQRNVPSREW